MIMNQAEKVSDLPLVEGVRVDLYSLRTLSHSCDPMSCRFTKCCCKSYEVIADEEEITRAVGVLPYAVKYAKCLREGGGLTDPFEEGDEGETCLRADEDNVCIFAYHTGEKAVRCALHTAALDLDLAPVSVKPMACSLWPLFLQEGDPPLLTVQDDATTFPCNDVRRGKARELDAGIRKILASVFGTSFLNAILELLE